MRVANARARRVMSVSYRLLLLQYEPGYYYSARIGGSSTRPHKHISRTHWATCIVIVIMIHVLEYYSTCPRLLYLLLSAAFIPGCVASSPVRYN